MRPIVFTPTETEAQIEASLRERIARLPVAQRLVYTLYYFEELSLDQISLVVDEPEDEVAALFYWAHANIGAVPMPPTLAAA